MRIFLDIDCKQKDFVENDHSWLTPRGLSTVSALSQSTSADANADVG